MALVLVVEDEKDLRNLLSDILIFAGYDVIEAKDGGAGLEKAWSERPDVILLDVMMPVMDGFDLLTKLRENPVTNSTPVVMLTAYPATKGELPALRLGARHYIRKPFEPELVTWAVKVALREAEDEDASRVAADDDPRPTAV